MSDVNKLDNTDPNCSLEPTQYKVRIHLDNDVVAPVGSFPWAIIQVYLGNKAYRSGWGFPDEYIRTSGESGEPHYIRKRNQDDMGLWKPTEQDLIACDWQLMCPEDSSLSFNLKLGTSTYDSGIKQDWGYMSSDGDADEVAGEKTFGTLTIAENKTTSILNILMFYREEINGVEDSLRLRVSTNKDQYQGMVNFIQQPLSVTVDGEPYNIGTPSPRSYEESDKYRYTAYYKGNDAEKLGIILKQVSKTKTFCLSWK